MNVLTFSDFGGPEVFRTEERPLPAIGASDVLIRVASAGVNRADLLQREGRYPPPAGGPAWPGLEVSGVIESVGAQVPASLTGTRVCALLAGGGYAEYVAAPASLALPVPDSLPLVDAGGLIEAACTVWSNLREAGAEPGETLLVHGGSGGIGTTAIQIGKALGMRVLTTARGDERTRRCRELGADDAIDYTREDFVERARAVGGADVILDILGGAFLDRNVAALAPKGRIAIIGLQRGSRGELDLRALLGTWGHIFATTLRARPLSEKAQIVADVGANVWPWIPDSYRPIIHGAFPLAEGARAHRMMESGEVFGKVVLVP